MAELLWLSSLRMSYVVGLSRDELCITKLSRDELSAANLSRDDLFEAEMTSFGWALLVKFSRD